MTSFSVTSIKKAISEFQEDSAQFTTQQKSDPLFPSGWASEVFGRPSVSRRFQISFTDMDRKDSLQLSGRGLNKETREGCYRKAVTVYHPNVLSLLLDSA
jgi:hypothetical protein